MYYSEKYQDERRKSIVIKSNTSDLSFGFMANLFLLVQL